MLDDDTFARKICVHLGRQPEVPARVVSRLSKARANALMRLTTHRSAWVGLVPCPSFRAGAGIALAALGFAYGTWQLYSSEPDFADLDAELLTGELPPAAYLDPGFARVVSGIVNE